MSESKGKIIFAILAVLLLLFGGGVTLYPFLNGLWVEYTMHKDSEEFLLLLEDSPEETKGGVSYVIAEEPEKEEATVPEQYPQLWLDMKAYNEAIFREGQEGLSDPAAYETPSFLLSDYGLDSEVFGVLSIPRLELRMPIYLGATKENMANGAAVMGQTSLPIGGENTNCVLAGHRGWNGAAYFLYVDRLIPGDTVTVTNLWETLNYKVSDIKEIDPNDVEAIHIQAMGDCISKKVVKNTGQLVRARFMVWENVPGAFSSGEPKGEDFRIVLEEIIRIVFDSVSVPGPDTGRWESSGCILLGDSFSLAWRVLDAQYWGVPQRRRRIYLVADFGGQTAPKILFNQESLPRDFTPILRTGQAPADGITERP